MSTQKRDRRPDDTPRNASTETGTVSPRVKRVGGVVIGMALVARGLRRRSVRGAAMALLGADRVVAIDRLPERLDMAREHGDAEVIDYEEEDVYDRLMEMTGDRGPDSCIDAVGTEAHGTGLSAVSDRANQTLKLEDDRPYVLREAIRCCRKGGTLSVPGVYIGRVDNLPFGSVMNKGLTIKTGQTHVQRYLDPLLERIEDGEIEPSFVVTHRADLEDSPQLYETFNHKHDDSIKIVLEP